MHKRTRTRTPQHVRAVAARVRKIDMVGRHGGNGNDSIVIWGKCFLEIQQLHLYTLHSLTHSVCVPRSICVFAPVSHMKLFTLIDSLCMHAELAEFCPKNVSTRV